MDIQRIKDLYNKGLVVITEHAENRLQERNITIKDLSSAIENGEIIENYDEDDPLPSCLILNIKNKKPLHVVVSDAKEYIKIVTAYVPDSNLWYDGYKKRVIK